jgi:hypothetical protein
MLKHTAERAGKREKMKLEKNILYELGDSMTLDYDHCFLCGSELNYKIRTDEHVFPRWLLRRFDLYNESLTLLNGTYIRYSKMVIPCCSVCNGTYLKKIEDCISSLANSGYDAFVQVERLKLFQWMGKIFYGILFRELSLLQDLSKKDSDTIVTANFLERFKMFHVFLQSVRIPFNFMGFSPWSLFIFNIHTYDNIGDNFDYLDNIPAMSFAIRFGEIGVIACLQDNGAQEQFYSDFFYKFQHHRILPIQFTELFAMFTYKTLLMNRIPKYVMASGCDNSGPIQAISPPLQGSSTKPIYDEWVQEDYAKLLSFYLMRFYPGKGHKEIFDMVFKAPGKVMSWVKNEDNTPRIMDKNGNII